MSTTIFDIALPERPAPIMMVGAGGIVCDAHLPAYRLAGFPVIGITDIAVSKAAEVAKLFGIAQVYPTLADMVSHAPAGVVFDVAVPGNAIVPVLQQLPEGATVLIQKPMGENLAQAREILQITQHKGMNAGMNFQLRYAPYITQARKLIAAGLIGELCDIEININVYGPWHLWSFLEGLPRVEILYHSIHYIDLVRSLAGNPESVQATTLGHPHSPALANVRSTIIMRYQDGPRAVIHTCHQHRYSQKHQHAYIKLEGTHGAILINMGLLINYPTGIPDKLEYFSEKEEAPAWKTVPVQGSWFPHAFIGTMAQMMRAAEGSIPMADNDVRDCLHTMACVEAAYQSHAQGGVAPEPW